MSCVRSRQMLDAWIDGELDPATSAELGQHFTICAACSTLRDDRVALRKRVKAGSTYFETPPQLGSAVMQRLAALQEARPSPLRRVSWWQAVALAAAVAVVSSALTFTIMRAPVDTVASLPWQEQVVARHIAGLSDPRHLIEVTSSDRHTVKPWFQGKTDFAPSVVDLTANGYALLGARLEQFGPQPAAVLVYKLREHPTSLFMTRSAMEEPMALKTVRGFSTATWAAGGVRFAAVADSDSHEIERFAGLIKASR